MSKGTEIVTRITSVERLGTSLYGNPYFRVFIADEPYVLRTSIDAADNYGITNREHMTNPVRLKLTAAGRIYGVTVVTEAEETKYRDALAASMAAHPAGKGRN